MAREHKLKHYTISGKDAWGQEIKEECIECDLCQFWVTIGKGNIYVGTTHGLYMFDL